MKVYFTFFLLLSFSLLASEPNEGSNSVKWGTFSIGPVLFAQNQKTSFFSFLSYTPRFMFSENGYARLNLGASLLRQDSKSYPLFETAFLGGYKFSQNLGFEFGAGGQYVKEKFVPSVSTNLVWHLSQRFLLIRRLLFGYTAAFVPKDTLHEVRLAFGVDFGE